MGRSRLIADALVNRKPFDESLHFSCRIPLDVPRNLASNSSDHAPAKPGPQLTLGSRPGIGQRYTYAKPYSPYRSRDRRTASQSRRISPRRGWTSRTVTSVSARSPEHTRPAKSVSPRFTLSRAGRPSPHRITHPKARRSSRSSNDPIGISSREPPGPPPPHRLRRRQARERRVLAAKGKPRRRCPPPRVRSRPAILEPATARRMPRCYPPMPRRHPIDEAPTKPRFGRFTAAIPTAAWSR